MLVAVELDGAGSHPAAAMADGAELLRAPVWIDRARTARLAGAQLVTLADRHRPPAGAGLATTGRLDALMLACRIAPAAGPIGVLPSVATTLTEPFLVSSQVATLDFVSRGWAGWVAEVLDDPEAGGYVGPRPVPGGDARYAEAAEHIDVVRRLWDSWDDDAEIRDAAAQRFIDRQRIRRIDFTGRHLSVRGPSITPRPPQGQPVTAGVVDGSAALGLAAAGADLAFVAGGDAETVAARSRDLRSATDAGGRDPRQLRVLADVDVTLAGRARDAEERVGELDARHPPARERLRFAGTPATVAEQLRGWRALGVDGLRLMPAVLEDDLPFVAELVAGLRDSVAPPAAASLRAALGLPRPANRRLAA